MGHHSRQLTRLEAARLAAQRKKFIVTIVAVVVPFGILFSLFPSSYSSLSSFSSSSSSSFTSSSSFSADSRRGAILGRTEGAGFSSMDSSGMHEGPLSSGIISKNQETIQKNKKEKKKERGDGGAGRGKGKGEDEEKRATRLNRSAASEEPLHLVREFKHPSKPQDRLVLADMTERQRREAAPDNLAAERPRMAAELKADEGQHPRVASKSSRASTSSGTAPTLLRESAPIPAPCDLSKGKWVLWNKGPPYTNASCPWIHLDETCKDGIKRGDTRAFWRWKHEDCDVKQLEAKAFFKQMENKSLAFVGENIAKTQMQSLLCLLGQVQSPNIIYNDNTNKSMSWYFSNFKFTLSYIWSPYLVQEAHEYIEGAPEGFKKLHLDGLDRTWATIMPGLDVIVLGLSPRFIEPIVYVLKNQLIGCYHCNTSTIKEISIYSAYRAAIRTIVKGVTNLPGFTGTTFLHRFSMLGDCININKTNKQKEVLKRMREVEKDEIDKAHDKGVPNGSKLNLLDVELEANISLVDKNMRNSLLEFSNICVSCLLGPSNTWNEHLLHMLLNPSSSTHVS